MSLSVDCFGLKAKGLSYCPMFNFGLPNSEFLNSYSESIENQLIQNRRLLEECVKDIVEVSKELSEKSFEDGVEVVNHVLDEQLLEKSSCFNPDMESVVEILKQLLKHLESHPGSEEMVLSDLIRLHSFEGISLPVCLSSADLISQSTFSLHTAVDQSELVTESLWNDICLRLRRYFVDKLTKLPVCLEVEPLYSCSAMRRLQYFQSLCSIFSKTDVIGKYRCIRTQQLQARFETNQRSCSTASDRVSKFRCYVEEFVLLRSTIVNMIKEDFELFRMLGNLDGNEIFKCLMEIYFECLQDQAALVVEKLSNEQSGLVDSQKGSDDKKMPKSPSDFGFFGKHLKGGIRRQHSQSMENLVQRAMDQQFSDLRQLPEPAFTSLLQFVDCLLKIEKTFDAIYDASTWHITGRKITKGKRQKRLKSALKIMTNPPDSEFQNRDIEPVESTDALPMINATTSVDRPQFEWRHAFYGLSTELAQCVGISLQNVSINSLREERDVFEKTCAITSSQIQSSLVGENKKFPNYVSKATWEIITEMVRLLPAACLGVDSNLSSVRSAFVETAEVCLEQLNSWFIQLSCEPASKAPVSSLYIALASSAFLRTYLITFAELLRLDEATGLIAFRECCDQFDNTTNALANSIEHYHVNLLTTSILHDAQSHNWIESKEFYEGERCSLSVQMWNFHMRRLRSDLCRFGPASMARIIFANILKESLSHFAWQYARVQPSERRLKQFLADITTILLCTSELLLYACEAVDELVDPCPRHLTTFQIHDSCSILLSILAVVGSPVEYIYRFYRKGFHKMEDCGTAGYHSYWLACVRPELALHQKRRLSDLQTNVAIFLQLNLLKSHPGVYFHHILQVLLMKDFHLPILVLEQISDSLDKERKTESSETASLLTRIFLLFTDVLIHCQEFPEGLEKVLIRVIDRSDSSWPTFDSQSLGTSNTEMPVWFSCIMKHMELFITRVTEPGIKLLLNKLDTAQPPTDSLSVSILNDSLPCGCKVVGEPVDIVNSSAKDIIAECIYSVISQIVADIHALPLPLVIFFRTADDKLKEKGINVPFNSVGIKVLALCLRLALTNADRLCSLVGNDQFNDNLKDHLKMLSECLFCLLTNSSCHGSGNPRIAGLFLKANRNWMSEQIETITDHFKLEMFEHTKSVSLDGSVVEYTDRVLKLQTMAVLNSTTGKDSLMKIEQFINNNFVWLSEHLEVPDIFGRKRTDDRGSLNLCLDNQIQSSTTNNFNPLIEYSKIGETDFDHTSLMNFSHDWSTLVQSDLGLSQVTFCNLLMNRPDMRDVESVEDDAVRRMLEALHRKYHKDSILA